MDLFGAWARQAVIESIAVTSCTNSRKELRRCCSPIGQNNTKHFLCPIRSQHSLDCLEMVRWESVPRGSSACVWKLSSRLFSRLDWLPLGLRGWSVSRVRSKTIHSLFCITSSLPYISLYYIDSRFFCPWNNRVRLFKLPPRSLASSLGCSLAINGGLFYWNWRVVSLSAHVSSNNSVSGATEEAREKLH